MGRRKGMKKRQKATIVKGKTPRPRTSLRQKHEGATPGQRHRGCLRTAPRTNQPPIGKAIAKPYEIFSERTEGWKIGLAALQRKISLRRDGTGHGKSEKTPRELLSFRRRNKKFPNEGRWKCGRGRREWGTSSTPDPCVQAYFEKIARKRGAVPIRALSHQAVEIMLGEEGGIAHRE